MDRKSFDQQLEVLLKKAEDKIPNEILPDLPFMELAPENEEFKSVENEEILQDVLDAVFETISEEWEFEFADEDNLSEDETDNNDDLENE